jgi:hypothetical protein
VSRRNHIDGLFARFSQKDMHGLAYKSLPPLARLAIFELDLFYWESGRRNPIEISQRWFAELLTCDPKTAGRTITALDDHGFIERERCGGLKGPVHARAAVYRLNWHPDNEGQPATFDFRRWQPPIVKNNAGNSPASTRDRLAFNGGKQTSQRGTMRCAGESAREMLERQKAQQNSESGTGA